MPHTSIQVSFLSLACVVIALTVIHSTAATAVPSSTSQAGANGAVQQQRKARLLSQPTLARLYKLMIARGGAGYFSDDDDSILDDADSYLQKRQQYDDYGHMRFGKRNPKDFDDYGHMRFGK